MRCIVWTFVQTPFQRKPSSSVSESPSTMHLLAADLCCALRGCDWTWSKGLFIAPQTRTTYSKSRFILETLASCIGHTLLVDIFHYSAQRLLRSAAHGSSIFSSSLSFPGRYILSSTITLFSGLVIYAGIQLFYDFLTLCAVIIFRQDPSDWPLLFNAPWRATSVQDLWAKRWHQLFRDVFVGIGYTPVVSLLRRFGGAGKALSAPAGVMGAFSVSGFLHYAGLWGMGRGTEFYAAGFFLMMGVGIILERVYQCATGRKVGQWMGWMWTGAWVVGWGHILVDAWARRGLIDSVFLPEGWRPGKWVVDKVLELISWTYINDLCNSFLAQS